MVSNWQNPHFGPLTYGIRSLLVGKNKWKKLQLPLPTKILTKIDATFLEGLQK